MNIPLKGGSTTAASSTSTTSTTSSPSSSGCGSLNWKGDGWCDDENNNAGCEYDGGDCCGENVKTTYCQECQCLDPGYSSTTTTSTPCFDVQATGHCNYWASFGYCTFLFQDWMATNCKKTCGHCSL